jgi:protoheme IX farnesyltransferase
MRGSGAPDGEATRRLINIGQDAEEAAKETPRVTFGAGRTPGFPTTVAPSGARVEEWRSRLDLLEPQVGAFAAFLALSAALAGGERMPSRLLTLGLACLSASTGAALLAAGLEEGRKRRRRSGSRALTLGAALLAVSLVATPVLGVASPLFALAGALSYAVLYRSWLERRTPFGVVAAGIGAGLVALAGWQVAGTAFRPVPFLLAAMIFLWVPTWVWSRSIVLEGERRGGGLPLLAVVAGPDKAAEAVFANALAVVVVSLLLVAPFGGLYAVVALVAGAGLVAAAHDLRKQRGAADRFSRRSVAYVLVLLAGAVLSSLS